ncbi:HIT family protein [Candidatus Nomurabacteria bacterium CG10_big_fil_rev_8_21_14_0_10_35_16]|uniref:HIT family protein n=1 Tax=Candidatus Nomurabacteria bacterium CG10_big_fil_rev_8_21_14_0_10_35_16 TaxID=1974731 RepID=A0A2H0TBW6_9BACT|nr:MAG: HIT family protein [Candidatus Nomurabacteria bacterium CG10_big_fil_rev_8_21_14_0_10_35_16]
MDDCIFCKIINKEIPADKVYEDDNFLAFLDIQPVSTGHILIIPKKHVVWMQDASDEMVTGIYMLTKKLMRAVKEGIGCDYVQISVVGTEIPHFHVHLIPRYFNDGLKKFPTIEYKKEEAPNIIKKIKEAIE